MIGETPAIIDASGAWNEIQGRLWMALDQMWKKQISDSVRSESEAARLNQISQQASHATSCAEAKWFPGVPQQSIWKGFLFLFYCWKRPSPSLVYEPISETQYCGYEVVLKLYLHLDFIQSNKMAPRIPDSVWERHRSEITAYYFAPKGTLRQTMQTMKERHGFEAT